MSLKVVFYAFSNCESNIFNQFKNELSKTIKHFSELEIINGNDQFKNTYHFIAYLIKQMNGEIDFDNFCRMLRGVSKNEIQSIRDKFPQAYRFFEDNKNIDINELSQSLTVKTLICLKSSGFKFKGQPCIHGLSESNGRYAVVIESYKNIVCHEVAHLFGADDHYIENDVYKMKEKCTDKKLCMMQYDPGNKSCSFCSTALKEIGDNMFKETVPFHLDGF